MKINRIALVSILFLMLLPSCFSIKYSGKKSIKKVYEEFFVDQGVMQYFVKPLEFTAKKYRYSVDFTFRDSIAYNSFVTANFSVFSKEPIRNIDSAYFIANNEKYYFHNCSKMFIDKSDKKYRIRYTSGVYLSDFENFCSNKPEIYVFYDNKKLIFKPTKKTITAIKTVKSNILDMIDYNRKSN